jgi:hypothetical protein
MEFVLDPALQPLSYIDIQTTDELMQYNFVPLIFNSFQFLKKNVANIPEHVLKDKHVENQEVSLKSMQQSCQFLQDPIVDVLNELCCPSHVSFSNYGLKRGYDIEMIR